MENREEAANKGGELYFCDLWLVEMKRLLKSHEPKLVTLNELK